MDEEIILTLPSNTSGIGNDLNKYSTQLAKALVLDPNKAYSVGLTELIIPASALPSVVTSDVYIYCSWVSPSFTGDSFSKLLRTVRVNQSTDTYQFFKIYYRPLEDSRYDSIDILLADQKGELYKFSKSSLPVIIVLSLLARGYVQL